MWSSGWSAAKKVRISYLGGDSHLGYAGLLHSVGYAGRVENDPNWSLSITSSAIGNNPAVGLVDPFEGEPCMHRPASTAPLL